MNSVIFKNLGIIKFEDAWRIQEELLNSIIDLKKLKRNDPSVTKKQKVICYFVNTQMFTPWVKVETKTTCF